MIHRHDQGARGRDLIDKDFRHNIKPFQNQIHEWIHANVPKDEKFRFKKSKQKAAERIVIREKQIAYVDEAIRVMKDRGIWDEEKLLSLNAPDRNEYPEKFLSFFASYKAQEGVFDKPFQNPNKAKRKGKNKFLYKKKGVKRSQRRASENGLQMKSDTKAIDQDPA